MNQLEQLRQYSSVVIDTGDIDSIAQWRPEDATTNPSLVLKALQGSRYDELIADLGRELDMRHRHHERARMDEALDRLSVSLGCAILTHIPGRVSTEIDARLSFDTAASVQRARRLIRFYQEAGVGRERVLIKIAATWEGLQAARLLEQEGIACNLTLLFHQAQAQAAAEAGVTLISPFVGRILDWHRARSPDTDYHVDQDPGVLSVRSIYEMYKAQGYTTLIMAASFRHLDEIRALAGCDKLTIAPAWLAQLSQDSSPLARALPAEIPAQERPPALCETRFRWLMNEDAMAEEKLAEGIRLFAHDTRQLEATLIRRWTAV